MSEELEPKKPKRTKKPSKKAIDAAMAKYLPEGVQKATKTRKAKASPSFAKTAKARKNASATKPRLSETITFGALIDEKMTKTHAGFLYRLELTHHLAPGIKYHYVGKKGFNTGMDWHYYQSSSEKVMERLNAGWVISTFTVLGFEVTESLLARAEASLIVKQWLGAENRRWNLNMAVVLSGVKWTRYMYCKRYLGVIDHTCYSTFCSPEAG